ncbi:Pollen Ole e 1 allergen/extensin [Macleaya cordata]|uniref:Pollen Ole e 1 allergen/extensin n=1 Tax=Macleaya cordata TaxID=56857 RepID=A0A200QVY0_MACCD|nr:Pollen Ole e 1 allergen/extensin [Macleaya cordata]
MASRMLVLFALCVFPALISASRPVQNDQDSLLVRGKVYCDTCQAGFETTACNFVAGAKVKLECKDRKTLKLLHRVDAVTDKTGSYEIKVAADHGDQLCETALVSSPDRYCAKFAPGRERARVILTSNNGIVSNVRYANNMGFMADQPMAGCAQVLKQYQEDEDDV